MSVEYQKIATIEVAKIMLRLMEEVASDRFIQAITALILHSKDDVLFKEKYDCEGPGCVLNTSRRYVASVYERVRMLYEREILDKSMVADVLEPGSVRAYLTYVNPLNASKPGAKASVATEKAFWEPFATPEQQ